MRAAGPLRVCPVHERGEVREPRGHVRVQVRPGVHRSAVQGRHSRVQQQPMQIRHLPQYARQLQVSRVLAIATTTIQL